MSALDSGQVLAELEPEWLDGLDGPDREEGRGLLSEIVDDWAREANGTPDPAAVHRFQRQDLEALARDAGPGARLEALRTRALGRRVDRLGARTLALGRAILDGSTGPEEARPLGRSLLAEAEALGPRVRDLPDTPHAAAARRELSDAVMEALFAVEGSAMSARLAREAGDTGPPDVTP